jgi:hypothetical protein
MMNDPQFLGDCGYIFDLLKDRFKDAKSGSARRQMYELGNFEKEPRGAWSITLGTTFRDYITPDRKRVPSSLFKSRYETVYYTENKDIFNILKEFINNYYLPFEFSEIQINFNWQSPIHLDKGNKGESVIIALGDYTGGELCIVGNNQSHVNDDHHEYDINCRFLKFDGAKHYHYTKDFEGDRMSIVFYNIKAQKLKKTKNIEDQGS